MGIFQQFPYSNFHEMNLDQIIKIMRQMQDEWENTKTEWASYKDFIDNFFANLDVSDEVLAVLQTWDADGRLDLIIDPVIAAEVAAWLADNITQPTTPAIDTSLTIAGAAADAKAAGMQLTAVKDGLSSVNIQSLKTVPNSRWPRAVVPVENGHSYVLKILNINSAVAFETAILSQSGANIATGFENGNPVYFSNSSVDPVYISLRYASEPAETPIITFYLADVTENNVSLQSAMIGISSSNAAQICSSDLDNLGVNTVFSVGTDAVVAHRPFDEYFTIATIGKFPGLTSGNVQIAFSIKNKVKYRIYNGAVWTEWFSYLPGYWEMGIEPKVVKLEENSRWSRIAIPVEPNIDYFFSIVDIMSDEEYETIFLSQNDVNLISGLTTSNTGTFKITTTDYPVYIVVRYPSTPATQPIVAYSMRPCNQNNVEIKGINMVINDANKAAICGGDLDNLALNSITAVTSGTTIAHSPAPGKYYTVFTQGKAKIRTSGDLQLAYVVPDGEIWMRLYDSGVWQSWKNITNNPTSRIPGFKFAIIGDSISTFDRPGYKYGTYTMAYPMLDVDFVNQTWWKRVLDASGAELDVNVSSGGARVTNTVGTPEYPDFYAKTLLLDDPDVIIVALGTNDSLNSIPLGNYDYNLPIEDLYDQSFRPAYIKGIKSLMNLYPNAKIICVALSMTFYYEEAVRTIAGHYDLDYVNATSYDTSEDLTGVHPSLLGMSEIASKVLYPNTAI